MKTKEFKIIVKYDENKKVIKDISSAEEYTLGEIAVFIQACRWLVKNWVEGTQENAEKLSKEIKREFYEQMEEIRG